METPIRGPLAVELMIRPCLALSLRLPDGSHYIAPITPTAGQALVLALLAQPEVAGTLTPELLDQVGKSAAEYQRSDAEFAKSVGVAL